jgi:uncharacterized protein (TIGR00369 family)
MNLPPPLEEEIRHLHTLLGPGVVFPPPCFLAMKAEFTAYESRTSLSVTVPVGPETLNPAGTMQGGFIVAALDNVLGPLSYLALRSVAATLDIHTQFIRAPLPGDALRVTARVVSRGMHSVAMAAEARNGRGKLVALASANALAVRASQPA